jgi:hypothetical protein
MVSLLDTHVMARVRLPAAKLYAVLEREFRARRPAACASCHVPLPYYCEAPDEVSANWRFGTPSLCPHGCHLMIAELLTGLWTRYDIEA